MTQAALSQPTTRSAWWAGKGRLAYFQLVLGVCVVNGLVAKAVTSVMLKGLSHAVWTLFDVSAIIWIAAAYGLHLAGRGAGVQPVSRADMAVGAVAVLLAVLPLNYTSWIGLILAAGWLAFMAAPGSEARRGARILLALTVPLFWARLTFSFAGDLVLHMDALVTGRILGTPSHGNVVQFADGSGYFQIYPACSSLVNMSLALLAWWTVVNVAGSIASRRVLAVAALLALTVFLINIVRLVALGTYPQHFELIHGDVGSTVVSWVTLAIVALICWLGLRGGGYPSQPAARPSDPAVPS